MRSRVSHSRALSAILAAILVTGPQLASGQESKSTRTQQSPTVSWSTPQQTTDSRSQAPAQQAPGSGTVDPSAPPLAPSSPAPTNEQMPTAPSATQQRQATQDTTQTPMSRPSEPSGTAAAESVRTVGGGASRPAGTAIAPAKQRQRRSLLIKVGALAAVGAAAGIVYGLTRATSSVPPNTR